MARATAKVRAGKKPGGSGPGALIVDTATLAKYLKVSERTVRDYAKRKGLPKLRQDSYNLVDVRLWEIGRLRKEMAEQQYDQNRLIKANADEREHRAELVRIRKERLGGLLIEKKEVERGWIERIIAVKSGLGMLGRSIAARISDMGKNENVETVVEEEVEACLERFAGGKGHSQTIEEHEGR